MKNFIYIFILFSISLHAGVIDEYSRNKKVVVVFGEEASKEEKDIAQKIYNALELDQTGDLYDHIINDTYALKHKYFYSKFHLIIVGNAQSNKLCNDLSDIQTSNIQLNQSKLPTLKKINSLQSGVFFSRYGHFSNDSNTGFIRRMLNPFSLESYNLSEGLSKTGPMTATYISGTSLEGLINAYISFLDLSLLEGVVTTEKNLAKNTSRFKIGQETISLPMVLNDKVSFSRGESKLKYMGWIQGSLADYSGTYKLTGVSPEQICHLKFFSSNPTLMTHDDHSHTFLAIRFKDNKQSLQALKGLDQTMKLSLNIESTPQFKAYPCIKGDKRWLTIRKDEWLVIENFPLSWKDTLFTEAAKLFKF
jgi:hypothetical protein